MAPYRRTCCCCFTVTTGVTMIGMYTAFDMLSALLNFGKNFNWVLLIIRALTLPLFILCCFYRKSLTYRKYFAILYAILNFAEIVARIGVMYYIYNHSTQIDEACDKAQD